MMHGPEESDSVIVAVKPTNKAESSVAEPVEPRTETKVRIPTKPAMHSNLKAATHSETRPASVPI